MALKVPVTKAKLRMFISIISKDGGWFASSRDDAVVDCTQFFKITWLFL